MSDARWQQVRSLFEECLALPADRRASHLRASALDPDLRHEVEELLGEVRDDEFLTPPNEGALEGALGPTVSDLVGQTVGSFRVLRLIGRGGMGAVFEAQQEQPQRLVALKVLDGGLVSRAALRRFQFESEVLARLKHPGIAQVFESGTHEDPVSGLRVPYFAMERVDGARTLTAHVASHDLSLRRRLELFLELCAAVHHGHQKGVIHRDLKAANILVDSEGRLRVIDFGVAQVRAGESTGDAAARLTARGELLGTPGFMSPEQVAGGGDLDIRTDVYSLGVVLYELLTDRAPHDLSGLPTDQVIRTILHDVPRRPGAVCPEVPRDLDWIVGKALEKDRERRYPSALELAEDVRRHLHDEVVQARPPDASYRVARFVRRHRVPVAAGAVTVLALIAGTTAALLGMFRAQEAEGRASARAEQLEKARAETQQALDRALDAESAERASRLNAEAEVKVSDAMRLFLEETLLHANPARYGADVRLVDLLDSFSARVDQDLADQPMVACEMHRFLGEAYLRLESHAQARRHAERAVALADPRDAWGIRRSAYARLVLARLLRIERRGEESAAMAREVLADMQGLPLLLRVAGDAHREAVALQVLAELEVDGGRYAEAEDLYRRALALLEKNGDAETRHSMFNGLGSLHVNAREYEKASAAFEQALQQMQSLASPTPYSRSATLNGLAVVALNSGRPALARDRSEEALAGIQETLGPAHRDTLRTRNNLASALLATGEVRRAVGELEEIVTIAEEEFGSEDTFTLHALGQLLVVQVQTGAGGPLLERIHEYVERTEAALGIHDPVFLQHLDAFGSTLYRQGEHEAAYELLTLMREGCREAYGDQDFRTWRAAQKLSAACTACGELEQAVELAREAVDGLAAERDLTDADLRAWKRSLARVLWSADQPEAAEQECRDLLDAIAEERPAQDPEVLQLRLDLAESLLRRGETEQGQAIVGDVLASIDDAASPAVAGFAARARALRSE